MTDKEKAICKKSNDYLLDHFTQTFRESVHDDILTHLEESYANGYKDGFADGKPKWHDLRKDPTDLPKCTENEQVIFYVQEYYIEKYINHYCLGFYKKSFLYDDVKLFVERSKGYECEHPIEEVLRWCELPKFEE